MLEKTDSIIFDLDGTLWNATHTVAEAWQQALSTLDYVQESITQQDVQSLAGTPYDVIFEKLFPSVPLKYKEEVRETCARQELEHLHKKGGQLYSGLAETLAYLHRKYKLAIVSNCQSGYIEAFFEYSNLQRYFVDSACYGTARLSKADNIKEVVKRNHFKAPVYVGDTKGDYEASVGAKVPFVFAAYGFGEVSAEVPRIESFSDLRELF